MVEENKRFWLGKRIPGRPGRKPKLHRPEGVSILPIADAEPMILCGDNDEFSIISQSEEVTIEKHMISDETNIPASVSNKVGKIWTGVKEVFHKSPPTAITSTSTRSGELSNRDLKKVNYPGIAFMLFIVWLVYKTLKGK